MKNIIFLVLLCVSSSVSFANPMPRTPGYVCGRIHEASLQNQCFWLANNNHFDEYACGACDQFESSQDTLDCMNIIKDASYSPEGVFACDYYNNVALTEKCLTIIRGQYVMPAAVRACERLEGNNELTCLGVIAGRKYSLEQVRTCDLIEEPMATIECFRN